MQLALMEQTMDYDTFVSTVKQILKERMGDGYDIRCFKVMKNNSLELDSLVVLQKGRNIAPNIYLKSYYEAYLEGTGIVEIVDRLYAIYMDYAAPELGENFQFTLSEMRSNIFYRLISLERNDRLLRDIPHIRYLDMAITFHCVVRDEPEGIGTVRITNEHMKFWEITLEELRELAIVNTERLFPATIRSMEEVLMGMLQVSQDYGADNQTADIIDDLNEEKKLAGKPSMYILTNEKGINGAACILYENVIRSFASRIKSDLYLLPSSIHEMIIIPKNYKLEKENLRRMVEDVNRTQVAVEEVLSDQVYIYSRDKDAILM